MKRKRLKTNGFYVNACLVHRYMEKKIKDNYGLSPSDIEVLLSVDKLTSGELGYCTINGIKGCLTGYSKRNAHTFIVGLLKRDFLLNHGKVKYYLELSGLGQEVVKYVSSFMIERISYLNDSLILKNVAAKAKGNKKKKGFPL